MSECAGKDCKHESHLKTDATDTSKVSVDNQDSDGTVSILEKNQTALKETLEDLYNYYKSLNRKGRRNFDRRNGRFKQHKLVKGIV